MYMCIACMMFTVRPGRLEAAALAANFSNLGMATDHLRRGIFRNMHACVFALVQWFSTVLLYFVHR